MKYTEVTFSIQPYSTDKSDILAAMAGEIGFESFTEMEDGLKAYIQDDFLDKEALEALTADFPFPNTRITFTLAPAAYQNWNEEWEQHGFQPIVIDNRCCVHSTTHQDIPQTAYDIVINPQMSFGSGYHETTQGMIREILDADLKGKTVLDMGCGTCILGILSAMRGASHVTAIDIDEWSVNNARQNVELNHLDNVDVEWGDAHLLLDRAPFDIILANINRNILLNDMPAYTSSMHKHSIILMSGFYQEDLPIIQKKAESLGLKYLSHKEYNNWVVVKFERTE